MLGITVKPLNNNLVEHSFVINSENDTVTVRYSVIDDNAMFEGTSLSKLAKQFDAELTVGDNMTFLTEPVSVGYSDLGFVGFEVTYELS